MFSRYLENLVANPRYIEKILMMEIPRYDALGIEVVGRGEVNTQTNHLDMAFQSGGQNIPAERFSRFAGMSISSGSRNSHSIGENLLILKLLETVTTCIGGLDVW
jgi:hypothetical protein